MEEQKIPEAAPALVIGKPPMSLEGRYATMTMKNLEGECRRLTKKPKLDGALAEALLVVFFKTHNRGNDPYVLDSKTSAKKTYDMYKTTTSRPRA